MKTATLLFNDVKRTRFMQAFDVFAKSKVILAPPVEAEVVDDFGQSHVNAILACDDRYQLIAVKTDGFVWRLPGIETVSNGTRWAMLDTVLS